MAARAVEAVEEFAQVGEVRRFLRCGRKRHRAAGYAWKEVDYRDASRPEVVYARLVVLPQADEGRLCDVELG